MGRGVFVEKVELCHDLLYFVVLDFCYGALVLGQKKVKASLCVGAVEMYPQKIPIFLPSVKVTVF